jgi:hypothetical protein
MFRHLELQILKEDHQCDLLKIHDEIHPDADHNAGHHEESVDNKQVLQNVQWFPNMTKKSYNNRKFTTWYTIKTI